MNLSIKRKIFYDGELLLLVNFQEIKKQILTCNNISEI